MRERHFRARDLLAPNCTWRETIPISRDELFVKLAELGIATKTVEHPPAMTVADNDSAGMDLPGAHTKNLFLKDDKGRLVLVIAKSDTQVDLKSLSKKMGLGRFSFGKPELMQQVLGIQPGAVTVFAVINDESQSIRVVIDQELMAHDSVNCHPLVNTASTNIARDDLLRFIRATGHEPDIMVVTGA